MSWVENNEWLKPASDTRVQWKYLRQFLVNYRPFWKRLTVAASLALFGSLTAFLIAPVFGTIQRAVSFRDLRLLGLAVLAYLGILLVQVLVNYVNRIYRYRVSTHLNKDLLLAYYLKLLNISIEDFIAFKQRSNLFQRVIDAMAITNDFTEVVIQGVQSAIVIAVMMVIIGMLSPITLAVVVTGAALLFVFVISRAQHLRTKRQRLLAVQFPMIGKMLEIIDGIFTIKALAASIRVTSDVRSLVTAKQDAEYDEVVADTRVTQIAQAISSCTLVAALGVSLVLLILGRLEYSETFALYVLVIGMLAPVVELARLFQRLSSLSANVYNYYQVLSIPDESEQTKATATGAGAARATDSPPAIDQQPIVLHAAAGNGRNISSVGEQAVQLSRGQLPDVSSRSVVSPSANSSPGGHIIFRDVEFAYRGRGPVLEGLHLEIQPGEKISLIGKSGSGKTTLLRLLLGFLQPQKGTILVDGVDIGSLKDKNEFRRQFGMVSQHDFFFDMTIKENMLFGLSELRSNEEITRALQLVNLWNDVSKLDQGIHASYSDNLFSGGQKQRFFIARSLLRNPVIVLLDEPTSALDFENEAQVIRAIEILAGNRTTITIAHRLSTVRSSDRVLVLNDKRIVATGTHEELLVSNDYYRALCQYNSFIL
ncbi:MAG TPA: ABC transporter ATP-binding protein [Pyrinomonadaceae bacterium]|nr:ABC transporter ATP-binding protein [Pyrinomonadaceae bacterium]